LAQRPDLGQPPVSLAGELLAGGFQGESDLLED
jgi:hypothetical protein